MTLQKNSPHLRPKSIFSPLNPLIFSLTLLIFGGQFVENPLQAQSNPKLYIVAAADTTDQNVYGKKYKEVLNNWCDSLRINFGIQIKKFILEGKQFNPENLMRTISKADSMSLDPTDALMVLYVGHGKDGEEGNVQLTFGNAKGDPYPSKNIESKVLQTDFRMKVTVFDACHTDPKKKYPVPNEPLWRSNETILREAAIINFKRLFFMTEGAITFFSSSPREAAWTNGVTGPLFSYYFFDKIYEGITNETSLKWHSIADETISMVQANTKSSKSRKVMQHPYFWAQVSKKHFGDKPPVGHPFRSIMKLPPKRKLNHNEKNKVKDDEDVFRAYADTVILKQEAYIRTLGEKRGSRRYPKNTKVDPKKWRELFFTKKMDNYYVFDNEGARAPGKSLIKVSYQQYINYWMENGNKAIHTVDSIVYDTVPREKLQKTGLNKARVNQYLYHVHVFRTVEYVTDDTTIVEKLRIDYALIYDFKIRKVRKSGKNPKDKLKRNPRIIGIDVYQVLEIEEPGDSTGSGGTVGGGGGGNGSGGNTPTPSYTLEDSALAIFNQQAIGAVEDFTSPLENIYGNQGRTRGSDGDKDLDFERFLFIPSATMEVSSLKRQRTSTFDLDHYLDRMKRLVDDPTLKQYDRVKIDVDRVEIPPQSDFKKVDWMEDLPEGTRVWMGTVRYYQNFEGYVNGKIQPIYADRTSKDTHVYVFREKIGLNEYRWYVKLGNIMVHSTLPPLSK